MDIYGSLDIPTPHASKNTSQQHRVLSFEFTEGLANGFDWFRPLLRDVSDSALPILKQWNLAFEAGCQWPRLG